MFHLKYPKCRKFMNWDEIGSLCRSLGYPVGLVKSHLTDEIHTEEDGLSFKELKKMLDFNLLYPLLHRTYNMHTANWNMAVIHKAAHLLDHRVLTFQDVHNIRVAYQTYEAGDMKGMVLDQCVLLRTLKMCERVIAPMKLMHRVKHMRESLEEKNRIQLSEFMDLILWCGLYNSYTEGQLSSVQGKEKQLFRLIDFDKLLSHRDERLSKHLDDQYLEEEWNFGQQGCYKGSKKHIQEHSLKTDKTEDARKEKQHYKNLKSEVGQSQQQVYRAHAGSIRQRPLSAQNLNMYLHKPEAVKKPELTAHTAYISIQKIIKTLETKVADTPEVTNTCILSSPTNIKMQILPHVISESDIEDTEKKLLCLLFDVETLEGRCEINKQEEMEYYIPKYNITNTITEHDQSESTKSSLPKYHDLENFKRLAYPRPRPSTAHSRICDARPEVCGSTYVLYYKCHLNPKPPLPGYRGWEETRRKEGSDYILVSQAFENCPQGRLYQKLKRAASAEVRKVHSGDFLYRPMKELGVKRRPKTAPAFLRSSNHTKMNHDMLSPVTIYCSSANLAENNLGSSAESVIYVNGQADSQSVDINTQCQKYDGKYEGSKQSQTILKLEVPTDGENLKVDLQTTPVKMKDSKPNHRCDKIPPSPSSSMAETELNRQSVDNEDKISLPGAISESHLLRDDLIGVNNILKNRQDTDYNKVEDDSNLNTTHCIVSLLLTKEKVERQKKINKMRTLQRPRNKYEDGFSAKLLQNAHKRKYLKQHLNEYSVFETVPDHRAVEKQATNASGSVINCKNDKGENDSVSIPDSSLDTSQMVSCHPVCNGDVRKNRYHRLLMRANGDLSKTFTRLLQQSSTL